jgi:hypothetical protein
MRLLRIYRNGIRQGHGKQFFGLSMVACAQRNVALVEWSRHLCWSHVDHDVNLANQSLVFVHDWLYLFDPCWTAKTR